MTSVIRNRIANKVLSCVTAFLNTEEYTILRGTLPRSIKLCKVQSHNQPTAFELTWLDFLQLKPELAERIHPDSFYTILRNKEWLERDGIWGVSAEDEPQKSFKFMMNNLDFAKIVLHDIHDNFKDLCDNSVFFIPEPPERVVVEFSSPNIAKPFHFGHFRSTIIGNFISNLFRFVGHDVTSLNYVGDWGLQYGILATGYSDFGSSSRLAEDPLLHLYEVYREANIKSSDDEDFNERARKHFQDMEKGNEEILKQWKMFREISLQKMNDTYARLGIEFTETHGESMYTSKTNSVLENLVERSVASYESDGSIQALVLHPDEPDEKVVLEKSDGTTLYLSRDLAAAIDRKDKYCFDSMYYVVDSSQKKHFSNLRYFIRESGHSWYKDIHHVPFGRILKFSTRKGNVVFLHDILNEARDRTLERMKSSPTTKVQENMVDVADVLGISALIVNDLSCRRTRNYAFDWEKILNMKGDSGIALQYCHARLNNIKENCGVDLKKDCDLSRLVEPQAMALLDIISRFDEVLYECYKQLEPCILVHYLFQLRHAVGKANKVLTVKGQPLNVARARLLLFHCAQLVLKTGLKILGVKPLDKM